MRIIRSHPKKIRIVRSAQSAKYYSVHTHSKYSAVDALPTVEAIVARAKELGYRGLGLTDHGNIAGTVRLYQECMKAGIKPFPGSELYLVVDREDKKAKRYHACVLAFTEVGYRNLIHLSTVSHQNFYNKPLLDLADLARLSEEGRLQGLAITTGCFFGMVVQTLISEGYQAAKTLVASFASWFEVCYVELQNHHIDQEPMTEAQIEHALSEIAGELGLRCILTQDSHYVDAEHKRDHETMKQLTTWSDNPDDSKFPGDGFHMVDDAWMQDHHGGYYAMGIDGLEDLLSRHTLRIPELDTYHYQVPIKSMDPAKDLADRALEELRRRGLDTPRYQKRMLQELDVLDFTGMEGYLLLVAEVTDYCRATGIVFQARGSASGSLICWLLGITSVDPLQWGLLMERFLAKDRTKPPDIDLDIESSRRQDLIDYLSVSYSVAQIGTWAELGMTAGEDGKGSLLVKLMASRRKQGLSTEWSEIPEHDRQALHRLDELKPYSGSGVHAAGLLMTSTRAQMDALVPMMWIASSKKMVSQYDMADVEKLGLVKLDALGLKTMDVLHLALENMGRDVKEGLDFIPLTDRSTYQMISRGDTEGIFQLSGGTAARGVRSLKPTKITDVIAAMALYRPATMTSGATDAYVERKHRQSEIPRRHEIIAKYTKDTYGILLYQEQVMSVLRDLGLDPDELTKFLKAVKASNASIGDAAHVIEEMLDDIKRRCYDRGMTDDDVRWLEEALEAYAGYGFNQCTHGSTIVSMIPQTTLQRSSANQYGAQEVTVEWLYKRIHGRRPAPGRWGHEYRGVCLSCGQAPSIKGAAGQCGRCHAWYKKFRTNGGLKVLAHKDGRIVPDTLTDVVYKGRQQVFTVRTVDGREITATANHRHLTSAGWKRVDELTTDDELMIVGEYEDFASPRSYLPLEIRLAVYERSGGRCEGCGGDQWGRCEIAHLDSDAANNRPSNLKLMCNSCHKKLDYEFGSRKIRWSKGRPAVPSRISEIVDAGESETYDVVMQGDDHSWVGNGIVTHNSHAVVYGLTAYRTAYLAANFPVEFHAALLTVAAGTDKEGPYISAARRRGVRVMRPHINESKEGYAMTKDKRGIRKGFLTIKGVGSTAARALVASQPYHYLDDLTKADPRAVTGIKTLKALLAAGREQEFKTQDIPGVLGKLRDAGVLAPLLEE